MEINSNQFKNKTAIKYPKVSIIVPVFNIEQYLKQCLQSIMRQSYANLEVILVDDGSTDDSGRICEMYSAQKDNWITIHQNNQGLSGARNTGLDRCSGQFIYFLDSDDLIHPRTISILVDIALETNSDIVEADFIKFNQDNFAANWKLPLQKKYTVWSQPEALTNVLLYKDCNIMSCNKLINAILFENIYFPLKKQHEDEFTTPLLAEKAKYYTKLQMPLYAYRQQKSSIMHQSFSEKKFDAIDAMKTRYKYFKEKYPGVYDDIVAYSLGTMCTKFLVKYHKNLSKSQKINLHKTAMTCFKEIRQKNNLPIKQRISLVAQNICPNIYWKFILFLKKEL